MLLQMRYVATFPSVMDIQNALLSNKSPSISMISFGLDLRVVVEGNPLFVLILGLDGNRMCRVFATFLRWVRIKVCNTDIGVSVEMR